MVSADILALYRVWLGRATLAEALHRKQVRLEGSPADLRAFPQWFNWSPMADTVRAALADRSRMMPQSSKKRGTLKPSSVGKSALRLREMNGPRESTPCSMQKFPSLEPDK
jgi:hypothetical protein